MGAHAKLSPSAAERWLNCPGSVALTADLPDRGSVYAEEGTLAHAIGELKLRKRFRVMSKSAYASELETLKQMERYIPDMDSDTDDYLQYVVEQAMTYRGTPLVCIEQNVSYSDYVPDGYGTADCIIIGTREDTGMLEMDVIDLKYGKGVAKYAHENPQMRLYALGAVQTYRMIYGEAIQLVTMHIFQPRISSGISASTETLADLRAWGETTVRPAAERALSGQGETFAGAWCKFCKIEATCRTRAEGNTSVFEVFRDAQGGYKKPPTLSNAEVGEVLRKALHLEAWITALKEFAAAELLAGREVTGWKMVEGKSNRAFTDADMAFDALKAAGVAEEMLYVRKPVTLTEAEKLVGKKQFTAVCGEYVTKPPGKPALAPLEDKREAIANRITPEEAFKE